MPRFNGTGPLGQGPGTGRGLGPCGAGTGSRRGWGRGYARGLGWKQFWGYGAGEYEAQPQISKKEEKEILENEAMSLEAELKSIKARLSKLKGQK